MLLLPSNMVFSKVRSWNDVSECETNNNNNSVKNDILLRTPPRCMLLIVSYIVFVYLISSLYLFVSLSPGIPIPGVLFWRQQSANMHRHLISMKFLLFFSSLFLSSLIYCIFCPTHLLSFLFFSSFKQMVLSLVYFLVLLFFSLLFVKKISFHPLFYPKIIFFSSFHLCSCTFRPKKRRESSCVRRL